jgi:hypothetical protein
VEVPAAGGEVAQLDQAAAGLGAGAEDDHRLGHVGVVLADGGPGAFQRGDDRAGRHLRRRLVVGFGRRPVGGALVVVVVGPGVSLVMVMLVPRSASQRSSQARPSLSSTWRARVTAT